MSNKRPIDHPEAQAFAEHIRDNPDDHTPRLVYADWLDENGFPDHASEVRGDVEKPYEDHVDHVNDRAKRGVRLHQAGIDPVNGWKTEDIYHSQNPEEWEPDFGHTIYEHGVGPELIDAIASLAHYPGEHQILDEDRVVPSNFVDFINSDHQEGDDDSYYRNSASEYYYDKRNGYIVHHIPRLGTISLSRRLA